VPTYEYRCVSCEHQFERFQRMSDEAVKECEVCGEPVKRLLFPVAIHFKGSGFYSTDYAKRNGLACAGNNAANGGSTDSSSTAGTDSSNSSGSGGAAPAEKAETKAAAPKATAAAAKND
jgi:putative FmdB family regulatory protein